MYSWYMVQDYYRFQNQDCCMVKKIPSLANKNPSGTLLVVFAGLRENCKAPYAILNSKLFGSTYILLSSIELPSATEGFLPSPTLEQMERMLVPWLIDTQVEHLIPNHAKKSVFLPFKMNTMAKLS